MDTVVTKLGEKIEELLRRVGSLKEENSMLRQELVNLKAECEIKNKEIERLEELNAQRERQVEEIVKKIESVMD